MKKLFLLSGIALLASAILPTVLKTNEAKAQISKPITIAAADDTLSTGADTALVALTFDGSYKSVEGYIYGLTGTVSGKIVFQGQRPSGVWDGLDSLALTDVDSAAQSKLFTVPATRLHVAYRLKYYKGGTAVAPIKAWYVRYTGGAILRTDPYNGFAWNNANRNGYRPYNKNYITNWKGELFFQLNKKSKLIRTTTRSAA